jgi:hypothetical protein
MDHDRTEELMRALWIGFAGLMAAALVAIAADEIKVNCQLTVNKGVLELDRKPGRINIDMNGDTISDQVQTFTVNSTDQVAIATGIATNGIAWFRNLTTNTTRWIDLGPTNAAGTIIKMLRLKAEEVQVVRLTPGENIFGHPTTSNVNLRVIVVED